MRTIGASSSSPTSFNSCSICWSREGRARSASDRARPHVGSAGQAMVTRPPPHTAARWGGRRKPRASFDFWAPPVDPPLAKEFFDGGVLAFLAAPPAAKCFSHRRGHGDRLFPVYPG